MSDEKMMEESKKHVHTLIKKAADAGDLKALDAMQFTQAALNAANALAVLASIRPPVPAEPPLSLSELQKTFYDALKDFNKEAEMKRKAFVSGKVSDNELAT